METKITGAAGSGPELQFSGADLSSISTREPGTYTMKKVQKPGTSAAKSAARAANRSTSNSNYPRKASASSVGKGSGSTTPEVDSLPVRR